MLTFISEVNPCPGHWRRVISTFFGHHISWSKGPLMTHVGALVGRTKPWKRRTQTNLCCFPSFCHPTAPFQLFSCHLISLLAGVLCNSLTVPSTQLNIRLQPAVLSPLYTILAPQTLSCWLWKLGVRQCLRTNRKVKLWKFDWFLQCLSEKPASCFHLPPNDRLWGNVTSFLWYIYSAGPHFWLDRSQPNKTACPW